MTLSGAILLALARCSYEPLRRNAYVFPSALASGCKKTSLSTESNASEGVNLPERLQLKFVESKIFKSGCVVLYYLK